VLRQWVLDGMGIDLKSAWDIQSFIDEGRLVEVLPEYRPPDLDFYVVYPERNYLPAKTRVFVEFLMDRMEQADAAIMPTRTVDIF
jgi:DNA-binding transcriptional LysR family regulator